jgi:hypothetical protein
MKLTHSFTTVWCAALAVALGSWLAPMAGAQVDPLQEVPFRPSPSVVKGTVCALTDASPEVVTLAVRALADWREPGAAPVASCYRQELLRPSGWGAAFRAARTAGNRVAEVVRREDRI